MAGEYKSACGCKIHVAQWTAKRKVVTQESCPLHKAAPDLLAALVEVRDLIEGYVDVVDGDLNYGQPQANKAMRAVQVIDDALAVAARKRKVG